MKKRVLNPLEQLLQKIILTMTRQFKVHNVALEDDRTLYHLNTNVVEPDLEAIKYC